MVVYQVKIGPKHKKAKSRLLASDINFKVLHTGCSIAHDETGLTADAAVTFVKMKINETICVSID